VFTLSITSSLGFRVSTLFSCSKPNTFSNRLNFIFILSVISGRLPVLDATHPDNRYVLVSILSNSVSKAKLPPGVASFMS